MIAVDTNLLVFAHRRDSPQHQKAAAVLRTLCEGRGAWALPWPCIHEFYSVVTHPRIYVPPSTAEQAISQIEAWLTSPVVSLLTESASHWDHLKPLLTEGWVIGPRVHDARIAALCLQHGTRELLTFDRDFSRFPELATRNPLVDRAAP